MRLKEFSLTELAKRYMALQSISSSVEPYKYAKLKEIEAEVLSRGYVKPCKVLRETYEGG